MHLINIANVFNAYIIIIIYYTTYYMTSINQLSTYYIGIKPSFYYIINLF